MATTASFVDREIRAVTAWLVTTEKLLSLLNEYNKRALTIGAPDVPAGFTASEATAGITSITALRDLMDAGHGTNLYKLNLGDG